MFLTFCFGESGSMSTPDEDFAGILVGGWNLDASEQYTRPRLLGEHLAEANDELEQDDPPAAAEGFRKGMERAARRGALIYGECGGYMALGRGLGMLRQTTYTEFGDFTVEVSDIYVP